MVSHNETQDQVARASQNAILNFIITIPSTFSGLKEGYEQFFDIIISHQISPATARADIHLMSKLLSPCGFILISGWEAKAHRFIQSIVEEFFTIKVVADLNGNPILKAAK